MGAGMHLRRVHALFALTLLFQVTRGGEIYDVTTVYDLGANRPVDSEAPPSFLDVKGRVYARTNSVGIPLTGNLSSVAKQRPLDDITCDFSDWTCKWSGGGWSTEYLDQSIKSGKAYRVVNSLNSLKIVFNTNDNSYSDSEYERYYDYGYRTRYVTKTKHYGPAYMYFTPDSTRLGYNNNGPSYVIEINPSSHTHPYLYSRCSTSSSSYGFTLKDRDNQDVRIYCQEHTRTLEISTYPAYLSFSFNNNQVKITEKKSFAITTLMDGKEAQNVKYFSMSGEFLDHMGASIKVPVYSSESANSELVSPAFALDSTRGVCLFMSVHTGRAIQGDLLQVIVKGVEPDHRQHVQFVNDLQAGWNSKIVKFDFANNTVGKFKLTIKTMTSSAVKINHIGSCGTGNSDQEVYTIPATRVSAGDLDRLKSSSSSTTSTAQPLLPIYSAAIPFTSLDPVEESTTTTSKNDTGCLPGFTGTSCQNGCGRNRFGQDCGGVCSVRAAECRGLLLCTADRGCHCATGYEGRLCTEQCGVGWFGNDCVQRCGHCAADDGTCDVYTGECAGCQPGYRPPYCAQEFVYYSDKPTLTAINYGKIQVSFNPKNAVQGTAELYQIQYREKGEEWKIHTTKSVNGGNQTDGEVKKETIEGLDAGVVYEVRVLLLDSDFNKYDGGLVQLSDVRSSCEIPDKVDYDINVYRNTSSITFSWSYRNTSVHWCPLLSYEVSWKEDWEWFTRNVTEGSVTLSGYLPGSKIEFKTRAVTGGGWGPFSDTVHATTNRNGTSRVRELRVVETKADSVKLAWEAPRGSGGQNLTYTVQYKCVEQPACAPGCGGSAALWSLASASPGEEATLGPLLPFARYQVTVSPDGGPHATIFVGTVKTVPLEKPLLSEKNKIERTNTSLTVFWEPVPVCSGFMLGYNYQLAMESDILTVLTEGFTRGTSFTFRNLSASTTYVVKVYIVTVAGWNPDAYLDICATTAATVPDAVRNLTVYKSGRSMVGVRWAAPLATYGPLRSFTIAHDGQSHTVEPTRCPAWPQLYCHTVEGLKANRQHVIAVSARNIEVAEDGAEASVSAVTKEASPTSPIGLRLSNASDTSVSLRWEHPDLANGQLRSFVVSVEETERFDQDACCQIYPLIETSVDSEDKTYEAEVSGLQPAATYYVSVSAKTVGLGPAQSLVVHTRPPHLPLATVLPSLEGLWDGKVTWPLQADAINSSDVYAPLVKAQLLLAVVTNETSENAGSGISDPLLDSFLRQQIGEPFLFIAEFKEGDAAADLLLHAADSEWGRRASDLSRLLSNDSVSRQLVAAQIAEYAGVYNADLALTTTTS